MMMHHELAAYNGGRGMERHAFELMIPPLQAYMWTTSNVQSRGVTRQDQTMPANCKAFQALKEARAQLYTHAHETKLHLSPFLLSLYTHSS